MKRNRAKDWLNEQQPDNILNYLAVAGSIDDAFVMWYNANSSRQKSFVARTVYNFIQCKPKIQRFFQNTMYSISCAFSKIIRGK